MREALNEVGLFMVVGWDGEGAEKGGDTFSKKKKKDCYFSTSQNIFIAWKIKIGSTLTSEKITLNG